MSDGDGATTTSVNGHEEEGLCQGLLSLPSLTLLLILPKHDGSVNLKEKNGLSK